MKTKLRIIFLLLPITLFGCSSNSCDDSKATSQWHNCNGTEVRKGKDTYVGEWKHGERSGNGELEFVDGVKYVGEFKRGEPEGKGVAKYLDNATYTGEWEKGVAHGHGTLIYSNGNKYVGEFREHLRHGQGTYTAYDKNDKDQWIRIVKGNWQFGKRDGLFTIKYKSTSKYMVDPILCALYIQNKVAKENQAYIGLHETCNRQTLKKYNDPYAGTMGGSQKD
jgi:hypothetical protein